MVASRVLQPMIRDGEWGMIALYAAQATALGYVSMISRDVMRGRYRDYLAMDAEQQAVMFFEAFSRGGAGSIFFDLMYQWAQFGQDPTGRFGGLSLSAAWDFLKILRGAQNVAFDLATGEGYEDSLERLGRDTVRSARTYLPGGTLPVIRFALDNLIYYPLMNQVSPDTVSKIEGNWEERTGGGYFFPISR